MADDDRGILRVNRDRLRDGPETHVPAIEGDNGHAERHGAGLRILVRGVVGPTVGVDALHRAVAPVHRVHGRAGDGWARGRERRTDDGGGGDSLTRGGTPDVPVNHNIQRHGPWR